MPLYSIQFDERHSNKAKTQVRNLLSKVPIYLVLIKHCVAMRKRHAQGTHWKVSNNLGWHLYRAEALSDCEISNSWTESSEEQIHQTAQLSINNKPDELSGPQIFDSQIRKDKVIKDDTLEYTMSVNESHGGHTTGIYSYLKNPNRKFWRDLQ